MAATAGTFQYFYCSKKLSELPNPEVATRDVTNSNGAGHKTEPLLELRLENWCKCRAMFVTAAAKRGLSMAADGGQHYLVLTTRHPYSRKPFIVGLMPFARKRFDQILRRYAGRWSKENYLPYVADRRMKIVNFEDAFSLHEWMGENDKSTIPGGQGGIIRVPDNLLNRVIRHFASKTDRTRAFLSNVRHLENELRQKRPDKWKEYKRCFVGRLRKAHCC